MSYGYHRHFPEGWAAGNKEYLGVNIEPSPDYVKLAEAFGAYGEKVEEPEDLEPAKSHRLVSKAVTMMQRYGEQFDQEALALRYNHIINKNQA